MGEPVNILETARQLIRYMGYEPEKDIPIEIIGVRPGERLEEPLTSKTEYTEQTDYPKILRLQNREEYSSGTLRTLLAALQPVCCSSDNPALYRNKEYLTRILCDACTSFREAQS
jgi:putative epimerase/dehydratase wbiI